MEVIVNAYAFPEKEDTFCKYVDNYTDWTPHEMREHKYGYDEFSMHYVRVRKDLICEPIKVCDELILSPDGCGAYLPGSDEGYEYSGEGFIYTSFNLDSHWCDLAEEYCTLTDEEQCEENCRGCRWWDEEHPLCSLDDEPCYEPWRRSNRDGYIEANERDCSDCGRYCFYKENSEEEKE